MCHYLLADAGTFCVATKCSSSQAIGVGHVPRHENPLLPMGTRSVSIMKPPPPCVMLNACSSAYSASASEHSAPCLHSEAFDMMLHMRERCYYHAVFTRPGQTVVTHFTVCLHIFLGVSLSKQGCARAVPHLFFYWLIGMGS